MTTKKWLKAFSDLLIKQFKPFLEDKGFKITKKQNGKNSFSIIFMNQDLYIDFGCSIHLLDYPYFWWLLLGEGSDEMPESDWNSIPLWELFDSKTLKKEKSLFDLNISLNLGRFLCKKDIIFKVKRSFELFVQFADGFLNNNLEVFNEFRQELPALLAQGSSRKKEKNRIKNESIIKYSFQILEENMKL